MTKSFLPVLLLLLVTSMLSCTKPITNEPGISLKLAEFRKSVISNLSYDLQLTIPREIEQPIDGKETITFMLSDVSQDIPLDFRESSEHLQQVVINGTPTETIFENEHLYLDKSLLTKGINSVDIIFTAGESSLNRNPEYLYTLFVPDRARTAFPLFDQPNLKATYKLRLTIPEDWEAISNAPVAEITTENQQKEIQFSESDLISSYLFSFVVGKFEAVTRTVNGREMTMLHRETDSGKVERNSDAIFELHGTALNWLETYTGISYPFQKFDFALIPSFQYGGMEHVGAIQYRASSLFLDESPSDSQLLSRASLIAHETAHMWFGDLVTMNWFNDVWTKEVFANFMASKIVNPSFPDINHDLNFLVRHYPSAYSVDRTEGANPIRQYLPNLNQAGTMYGDIIYNKAPIMMRQLELLVGEDVFQEGLQEYLSTYSFDNATWPNLIEILDKKSSSDLKNWSEVWVNTSGRPHFKNARLDYGEFEITQIDPTDKHRVWLQSFELTARQESAFTSVPVLSNVEVVTVDVQGHSYYEFLNSNGFGYGLFPTQLAYLEDWDKLDDVAKGSLLINIYENLLEGSIEPQKYLSQLTDIVKSEQNQLLLNLALGHIRSIYWDLLSEDERLAVAPNLETTIWDIMLDQKESSRKKTFFNTFESIALTEDAINKLHAIWAEKLSIKGLKLSESDFIGLTGTLAIKLPTKAAEITQNQLSAIANPDRKRRFEFILPALSNNQQVRDEFFESLSDEKNRQTESWVLGALSYLHHPLRTKDSEKYILPSLELLEEIQVTGDIFFPKRWVDVTLGNYSSDSAVKTVREFLANHPDYNNQLRMKILQGADPLFRSNRILSKAQAEQ